MGDPRSPDIFDAVVFFVVILPVLILPVLIVAVVIYWPIEAVGRLFWSRR